MPICRAHIPSLAVDPSLAPPGRHVASIFAQYAPVLASDDPRWPEVRSAFRDRVLRTVESLAPGFSASIEHLEVLAAPDLERVFGLTGGNIFHGALRPERRLLRDYRTPLPGLWLCGAGAHPGGGVMGAPGRNAALQLLTSCALRPRAAAPLKRARQSPRSCGSHRKSCPSSPRLAPSTTLRSPSSDAAQRANSAL